MVFKRDWFNVCCLISNFRGDDDPCLLKIDYANWCSEGIDC